MTIDHYLRKDLSDQKLRVASDQNLELFSTEHKSHYDLAGAGFKYLLDYHKILSTIASSV